MTFPQALRRAHHATLDQRLITRIGIGAVVTLVVAGLALLLVGMRVDIARVRANSDVQRVVMQRSLEVIETQAALIERSIRLQRELLEATRTGVETSRAIRGDVERMERDVDRTARAAEQIRRDVHEMNRRTGGSLLDD